MILQLEAHELSESLRALEMAMLQLNITPGYFQSTKEEYQAAINYKIDQLANVFDNYNLNVLEASDCPFIKTAINRGCKDSDDIRNMFDSHRDVPIMFHEKMPLKLYDYSELNDEINHGRNDDELKHKINTIYKRRKKRDKKANPLSHDAGYLKGVEYLRTQNNCWAVTSDSTLKVYAIENNIRDENQLAVGLDVVVGILSVNGDDFSIDSSNFVPLFKNVIRHSLVPEREAFEIADLAFILESDTKINLLESAKVIEIATNVKRKRLSGEEYEIISLYLRREIESEKLELTRDIEEAERRASIAIAEKEKAQKTNEAFVAEYKKSRTKELKFNSRLSLAAKIFLSLVISVVVSTIIFLCLGYINSISKTVQYFISISPSAIFWLLPQIRLKNRWNNNYKAAIKGIDEQIDAEIRQMSKH
jgi:hypothetical protein